MDSFTMIKPDDWHLHLRDGEAMRAVLPDTERYFGRALVMPNLKPPVCTVEDVLTYRNRILNSLSCGSKFEPYMTLYITDNTTRKIIRQAKEYEFILAAKLYPANATTHSAEGVTDIKQLGHVLSEMEQVGLVLSVHGELLYDDLGEVDVFDREKCFLEKILPWIIDSFPNLRVVLEHITTGDAVQFVQGARDGVVATITAHHLLDNRNALFRGGLIPHNFCLPVLKREAHRQVLLSAATSGSPRFFLGTDSAPHERSTKENACGCAGCYTAVSALPLYVKAFEDFGALNMLEGFSGHYGADFYQLPRSNRRITFVKKPWEIPATLPYADGVLVPFWAEKTLQWQVEN